MQACTRATQLWALTIRSDEHRLRSRGELLLRCHNCSTRQRMKGFAHAAAVVTQHSRPGRLVSPDRGSCSCTGWQQQSSTHSTSAAALSCTPGTAVQHACMHLQHACLHLEAPHTPAAPIYRPLSRHAMPTLNSMGTWASVWCFDHPWHTHPSASASPGAPLRIMCMQRLAAAPCTAP